MFIIKKQQLENRETVIPNIFFEYVLPLLAQSPHAAGVYLYGYYQGLNAHEADDEIYSNEALAQKLGLMVDDVYQAWQLCEDLGLISKHILDPQVTGAYTVEFKDLRDVSVNSQSSVVTADEMIVAYKNGEYKKMYDQVEQAMKYPLSANDIKKIHQTVRDFNISKDLVVEAMLYCIHKKKSRSVDLALGILRNWHLDGIRTIEDLEYQMQGKEKRYMEYKKILHALGEYRGPTEPEKELMDRWLDEYSFDIEIILDAIGKTTSIKTPNLNYVDGIIKNRLQLVEEAMNKERVMPKGALKSNQQSAKTAEEIFDTRGKILELIKFPRKTLRKDEMEDLDYLSKEATFADVEATYHWIKKTEYELTLRNMVKALKNESLVSTKKEKITLKQVRIAEEKYPHTSKDFKSKEVKRLDKEKREVGPMEKRLQQKRLEQMKKQGKI